MHTDTPGTQLPANCQFHNSSKDMGGRDAKKSQGMAVCSPQNCPQAVRRWQEGYTGQKGFIGNSKSQRALERVQMFSQK